MKIEFHAGEQNIFTGWIKDDQETFDELREMTILIAKRYMEFAGFFQESKGVHIKYYHLDSDYFGYDVVKWMITFTVTEEEGVVEKLEDIFETDFYTILTLDTEEVKYTGSYDDCITFLEGSFPCFDIDDASTHRKVFKTVKFDYSHTEPHIKL